MKHIISKYLLSGYIKTTYTSINKRGILAQEKKRVKDFNWQFIKEDIPKANQRMQIKTTTYPLECLK